jgi:flavin reductase (DIM6/NTAB) family NADH-FMN oxidoreductase RutF
MLEGRISMKKSLGAKTLVFPTPVWVVGTYDGEGRPNAMTAAWGGICCSQPPCLAVSLRKATYTYGNILARKAFTINVPSEAYARQADYFGMVSGKTVDKFAAAELTPVRSPNVDAPYIEEFPLVVECRLLHSMEIGLHTQFVGEILDVKAEDSVFDGKGYVDIEKVRPILFEPESNTYHGVGKLLGRAYSIGKEIR